MYRVIKLFKIAYIFNKYNKQLTTVSKDQCFIPSRTAFTDSGVLSNTTMTVVMTLISRAE